ncbi:hypothetical protein [Bacillus pseudomycoides]|uniref:hypothetical protein n=1 Tax=Bacillus pseudomycoides TaxID=64104 RepID=UPI002E1FB91C|nr:hypothetical protein [Bacillus pseudomycoides]
MLLEFQIKTSNFLTMFREKLKRKSFCITEEFQDDKGQTNLVDRIEIESAERPLRLDTDTTFNVQLSDKLEVIKGKQLQLEQGIIVYLVKLSDLQAENTNPVPISKKHRIPVQLVFDLLLSLPDPKNPRPDVGVTFTIRYSHVEGLLLTDEIKNKINQIGSSLPSQSTSLPLNNIFEDSGQYSIVNAGITTDSENSVIAMRVEFGPPPIVSDDWSKFYNGEIINHINVKGKRYPEGVVLSTGWSLFTDKSFILNQVQQLYTQSLNKSKKVRLNSGPSVEWSNELGKAEIFVSFNIDAIDACECIIWNNDVNADVSCTVEMYIPQNNTIRSNVNFSVDANDLQLLCCEVSAALFWPFVGLDLFGQQTINFGQYLFIPVVGPIGIFIGAIVFATENEYDDFPTPSQCQRQSKNEFFCDQPFSLVNPLFGRLDLMDYLGLDTGLLLLGTQTEIPESANAFLKSEFYNFEWIPLPIPCSSASREELEYMKENPFKFVQALAKVNLSNIGTTSGTTHGNLDVKAPIFLCEEVKVLDDPLNVFQNHSTFGTIDDFNIEIQIGYPDSDYWKNPYDCKILIKTNGGARLLTIPAPVQLTGTEAQNIVEGFIERIGECYSAISDWFKATHRYNPKWSVDPAPDPNKQTEHYWNVAVFGINPGERISFVNHLDQTIGVAHSNSFGRAQLSTITAPVASSGELGLVRSNIIKEDKTVDSVLPQRGIYVQQVLLTKESVIRLTTRCEQLTSGVFQSKRVLFAVTTTGLDIYSLSVPTFPNLIRQYSLPGIKGVIDWNNDILAWGSFGLKLLCNGRNLHMRSDGCETSKEILDIVRWNEYLYVLTNSDLDIYDKDLCKVSKLSLKGGTHLAIVGGTLVIGYPQELVLYGLENNGLPKRLGVYKVPAMTGLVSPIIENKMIFVKGLGANGLMIDLSNLNEPREVASYNQKPWFVDATQIGKSLARLDKKRKIITIYNTQRSVMI